MPRDYMTSRFSLTASPAHQRVGITVLRVITGIVFLVHGVQKVFTMGIPGVIGFFTKMGIPAPTITAPLISVLELAGGAALIIGVLTRLAALGLAADMLGALLMVHISKGFTGPGGYELVLILFSAALAIALAGPGALSVDDVIGRRTSIRG